MPGFEQGEGGLIWILQEGLLASWKPQGFSGGLGQDVSPRTEEVPGFYEQAGAVMDLPLPALYPGP